MNSQRSFQGRAEVKRNEVLTSKPLFSEATYRRWRARYCTGATGRQAEQCQRWVDAVQWYESNRKD